nr:reverse transcriptase domain-containing protein [Tanacetum cinerariifolium]
MLRACPNHGFLKLTQIDTFYNGLDEQDQDTLNVAAGGNLLSKTTREALKIIKNKSKVCYSRSKSNVSKVHTNSRDSTSKTDDRIDKLADQISNLVEIVNKQVITLATAKVVEITCVTCRGAHAYYDCIATDSNQPSVCATTVIVPNPKGEMKVVTTRSGLAYEGPSIPIYSPLEKVVELDTEEITNKEHPNYQGSTAHIHPSVVPIFIPKPDVPRTQPKPSIPYPSRRNDQKLYKLFELAKVLLNENCSTMLLKNLPEKLGHPDKFLIPCDFPRIDVCHALADLDRSITRPKGVVEDVFVKVGKFHFPTDFVVVDFEADPRVHLILGRSFLRTGNALIDVYGEEITLKEPIVKSSSPTLTPFRESDFFLEEINFLNDESIPTGIDNSFYDPEGDILFLEKLLNEDPFQLPPMDLKQAEETKAKSWIKEPPELELKELPLAGNEFYCFLDGFLGYFQIPIDPQDQEKTTFTCPYGTFAYRRMPFGLCNAPSTFQRCMIAIFYDMIEKTMKVFMEDFSVIRDSFSSCLTNLDKMIKCYEDTNLVLNWEMCHFMCKKGIVLGHKILKSGIKVDKSKVDVIAKLPHPNTVKGVRSFLGHAGFYRRLIQDFFKIARPTTHLLEKETPFVFSKECVDPFDTLKKKLTEASILVVSDWNLPFELMCDVSDFTIEHKAYWALKHVNFDLKTAGDHRKLQLNELNELRGQAFENSLIYKERTKKLHDSKIKNRIFNVGDQVLLFNSRLKIFSRTLKTRWSGPFTITQVFPYGTVELSKPNGPNFKVNGHHVKYYFRGDIPSKVVPDIHMFPMDK